MSTTTLTYPNVIRIRHFWTIGLVAILLIISFVLIGEAILIIAKSTPEGSIQADPISVVQNSIMPIAVPTSSLAELQPIPYQTSVPASAVVNEPSIISVSVPPPPSL